MDIFCNDSETTEIYTHSLHDALPISVHLRMCLSCGNVGCCDSSVGRHAERHFSTAHHPVMRSVERSEEHTSELQSRQYIVCRLLLVKNTIVEILMKKLRMAVKQTNIK